MYNFIDLTGARFGRLTVVERSDNYTKGKANSARWLCRCDCGKYKIILSNSLIRGRSKSCGCYRSELRTKNNLTHNKTNERIYREWSNMRNRCKFNETYISRGITVCDEWNDDFQAFYDWAIENGYSDSLTLDRINNDVGYCPENCRWATYKVQGNNKSNNHFLRHNGEKHTIAEWGRITGYGNKVISARLRLGWDVDKSLSTPVRKKN